MFRQTWMEVNLDAIQANIKHIKSIAKKKFIAVLKADAYGCGDIQVAKAALEAGADMIAVSSLDEALMFRNENYNGELLVLGTVSSNQIKYAIRNDIVVCAYDLAWIEEVIQRNCEGLRIHLKIDTGMNRIGLRTLEEAQKAYDLLEKAGCRIEGIFTHFCTADCDVDLMHIQYDRFVQIVKGLEKDFTWIHCDNSDASVYFKEDFSNACRVGISLYGISTYQKDLQPALALYTRISMMKLVPKGQVIGYGATYQTESDSYIATLPIGYADGLLRRNQGRCVYLEGEKAEIVGRICMDQCMIRTEKMYPLDTCVEIFGPHIPLEEIANDLDTIPYEIITLISPRVTRVYKQEGKADVEYNVRLVNSQIEE